MYLLKEIFSVISSYRKFAFKTCILWGALFTGCKEQNGQERFQSFSENFATRYFSLFPDESPLRRDNPGLNHLFIPTLENMDSAAFFYKRYSQQLNDVDPASLSPVAIKDYLKIKNILNGVLKLTTEDETNPDLFNIHRSLNRILRSPYAPLTVRLKTISEKLSLTPAFYEEAKQRLTRLNRVKSGQAIRSHIETYLFLDTELRDSVSALSTANFDFLIKIENAKLSVKDYIGFCESAKLN